MTKALTEFQLGKIKTEIENTKDHEGSLIVVPAGYLESILEEIRLARNEHRKGTSHHKPGNKNCGQVYSPQWEAYEAFLLGKA